MAASGRSVMINGGSYSQQRFYGRMIPKRGQVKVAIVLGLAHTFASIFSPRKKSGAFRLAHQSLDHGRLRNLARVQ